MFKNYFKPTPNKIEKFLLAFKTLIGTVAASTFFAGDQKIAFYFLVAGAVIDFLLRNTTDDTAAGDANKSNV